MSGTGSCTSDGTSDGKTSPTRQVEWFKDLFGFEETSPEVVYRNLVADGVMLRSKVNARSYQHGRLDIPSLAQLREVTAPLLQSDRGRLTVAEVVGDAQGLHLEECADGALFQVASQFNLLEMVHPGVTPGAGVTRYAEDPTQGPACAVACGAGTVFRNYFAPVGGGLGQTGDAQIDTAAELGAALGNADGSVWTMRNGYALGRAQGLLRAGRAIRAMSQGERDELVGRVRIGVHYDTEVTVGAGRPANVVSQAYCAAFPVAYSETRSAGAWEPVARVGLEGCYEATLRAALVNEAQGGSNRVYLTLVGGGVFGNEQRWILDAMERAFRLLESSGLEVKIVSFRQSNAAVRALER